MRQFEVAYFGASCDPPELNKEFATKLDLDFPLLSDPSLEVGRAYGVITGDKKNAARWTIYIGKDGKILHIEKMVAVKTHGADIAAKLKELGVAQKK